MYYIYIVKAGLQQAVYLTDKKVVKMHGHIKHAGKAFSGAICRNLAAKVMP